MSLQMWAYGIGIVYIGALFALAYLGYHRTETLRDLLVAPNQYGPIWIGLALGATAMSAVATMGNPGFVYQYGWSGMWHSMAYGGIVLAWTFAGYQLTRFSRTLEANSLPDFFGKRFQSHFLRAFTAVVSIFLITYIAAQFAGASWALVVVFDIPYEVGIIIGGVILTAYVMIGGAHAEILNSALQGTIVAIIGVIIIISGFIAVGGGIGEMNAAVEAQDPSLGWDNVFSEPLFSPFNGPIQAVVLGLMALSPQLSRLFFALESEKKVKHTILVSYLFLFIMFSLALIGGLASRAVFPDIQPDLATLTLVQETMADPIVAFVAIGIFAAIMSTTAGLFLALAIAITNDLYKDTYIQLKDSDISEEVVNKRTNWGTRVLIPIVAAAGIIIGLDQPEFLTILMWAGLGAFVASLSPLLLWATVWDGVTPKAAKIAAPAGLITYLILYFGLGIVMGLPLWEAPFRALGIGAIITFILTPGLSIITKQSLPKDFLEELSPQESRTTTEADD